MAIRRAKRGTNFTMISNVGLKDERLSLKATGLLAYMLSLPDDWVFYESELSKRKKDGKQSVRSGLKELQDAGYLIKSQTRTEGGKFGSVDWELHDEPINVESKAFSPQTDFPTTVKPTTVKPTTVNHTLLSTNRTKDLKELSTKDTKKDIASSSSKNFKHKHGEFDNVLLTEVEFEKLKKRFPEDYKLRIEKVSGYIASKGDPYKSHYATIINWHNRAVKEKEEKEGRKKHINAYSEEEINSLPF